MIERNAVLRDGHPVRLRDVEAGDAEAIQCFHRAVSPSSRVARFQGHGIRSRPDIEALVRRAISGTAVVLVALSPDGDIAGLGECAFDDANTGIIGHIGLLIADDHQGIGLGGKLWSLLAARARAAGVGSLVVTTTPGNTRMLRIVRGPGNPVVRSHTRQGVTEMRIDLSSCMSAAA